jgi:alcohol dehydrogenase class IV
LVVAVGGGTSIDMAKLIRALAGTVDPEAVIRGKSPIVASRSRFIAIPTTAGTGSEATQFAVVYIDGEKFSLDHASLRPAIAIVDPRLMNTLPAAVTAATGLDAFCQAIESIWAVGATDESVRYAQTVPTACHGKRCLARHIWRAKRSISVGRQLLMRCPIR